MVPSWSGIAIRLPPAVHLPGRTLKKNTKECGRKQPAEWQTHCALWRCMASIWPQRDRRPG